MIRPILATLDAGRHELRAGDGAARRDGGKRRGAGIQSGLGTGIAGLSWVIDGYTLAFASALVLAGGLGDRLGRAGALRAGLVLFTVASAALRRRAPGLGLLIAARMLQGLGAALFMPSSLALLARPIPTRGQRARAIGFWSALTADRRRERAAGGRHPDLDPGVAQHLPGQSSRSASPASSMASLRAPAAPPARARSIFPLSWWPPRRWGAFTWALVERAERGWGSPACSARGRRRRTFALSSGWRARRASRCFRRGSSSTAPSRRPRRARFCTPRRSSAASSCSRSTSRRAGRGGRARRPAHQRHHGDLRSREHPGREARRPPRAPGVDPPRPGPALRRRLRSVAGHRGLRSGSSGLCSRCSASAPVSSPRR